MQIAIIVSAAVHTAIVLWTLLSPASTKSFGRLDDVPVVVDLVPSSEAEPAPSATPGEPKPEPVEKPAVASDPNPAQSDSESAQNTQRRQQQQQQQQQQQKQAHVQPQSRPPVTPEPQEPPEEPPPTANWLEQALNFPLSPGLPNLGSPPSESKVKLPPATIAQLKSHVMKCWTPPAGAAGAHGLKVVIRVALNSAGKLAAEPALIEAPASAAGPALVQSALRAIQKCQPFSFLPADAYKEWRLLDFTFTPDGLTGV